MGLLDGKKILVTGVLTEDSIAFAVAQPRPARRRRVGAHRRRTRDVAHRADGAPAPPADRRARARRHQPRASQELVAAEVARRFGRLDGILHSIGYAPDPCIGRGMLEAGWEDVATAVEISAYSLKVLAVGVPAAARGRRRRVDRRARLRLHRRLAGLRLDGRRQGGARVTDPLPCAGSWAEGDPRQPRRRRTDPHGRGEGDPRFRALRGGLGGPRARSAGTSTGTARPSPRRASRCSPTGSRGQPARSSTSTADTTPIGA